MNTKELMIGNYVTINNTKGWPDLYGIPMIVTGIKERHEKDFPLSDSVISLKHGYETYSQFNEYIDPIPLTDEWLVKLGYESDGPNHYRNNGHIIWICNEMFICDKNGTILKYVHDLQNLFRALQKKQLTIKQGL